MPEKNTGQEGAAAAASTQPIELSKSPHAFFAPTNTRAAPILQAPPAADRARVRLLARRLHQLGEAPLYHFITDLERGADLRETLEIYAEISADFVKAFGGDRFPELFSINRGAAP